MSKNNKNQELVYILKNDPIQRDKILSDLLIKNKGKLLKKIKNSIFRNNAQNMLEDTLSDIYLKLREIIDKENFTIDKNLESFFWGVCKIYFLEEFRKYKNLPHTRETLSESGSEDEINLDPKDIKLVYSLYPEIMDKLKGNCKEVMKYKYESILESSLECDLEGKLDGNLEKTPQDSIEGLVQGVLEGKLKDTCWGDFQGNLDGNKKGLVQGKFTGVIQENIQEDFSKKNQENISGYFKGNIEGYFSNGQQNDKTDMIQANLEGNIQGKIKPGKPRSGLEVAEYFNFTPGFARVKINKCREQLYKILREDYGIIIPKQNTKSPKESDE